MIAEDLLGVQNHGFGFPTVWTNHLGEFTAYVRQASSKLYLQACSPGWASPYVGPFHVDESGLSSVTITVEPSASISGRWRSATGHETFATARLVGRRYGSIKRQILRADFNTGDGEFVVDDSIDIQYPFYIGSLIADTYTITYWEGGSSKPAGPVYTRTITLEPGQSLRDLELQPAPGPLCTVSGTVTFAGEPAPNASVQTFDGSFTVSSANGAYACTSIYPGETNLEAQYMARSNGLAESHTLRVPVVLEMNRTIHQDLAIASGPGTIEGTVSVNDKPAAHLSLSTSVAWDDGSRESISAVTNGQGRYRISGLPEGSRAIKVSARTAVGERVKEHLSVHVLPNGITQLDLSYRSGSLRIQTHGMREGETARLIILPGQVKIGEVTPELIDELDSKALFTKQFEEDVEILIDVPPGICTVIVGAYDKNQPVIQSTLATLRWTSHYAEIAEGVETVVQLDLE